MKRPETRYAWNGDVSLAYQVVGNADIDEMERLDGKVGGLAVSIGARVASLAARSEVLVSQTVKDLLVGSDLVFADRGSHELKGVPGTWNVYSVARRQSQNRR